MLCLSLSNYSQNNMYDLPQITIAQINVTVGDIAGNSAKILNAWSDATKAGAKLVVFPELCVIGYPPQDLILSPNFRKKSMQAVYDIAEKTANGTAIILGCVWEIDGKIYNAGLLLDGGKIVHVQPKTMLPNYGIFDEKRLFSEGNGTVAINWRGHKIAILICEDVWDKSLTNSLKNQALEVIFAINASPFEVGKYEQRLAIAKKAANIVNASLFYINMVGGQDDIVFDGGSFVVNSEGKIVCELPRFEENIVVIPNVGEESLQNNNKILHCVQDDNWQIWNAMKLGLADYVRKNGFSKVLIGLSGGIDSAVTVACAVDALGAENVLGVLLPSPYSSQGSIDDALESAKLLGIKTRTIPITSPMEIFSDLLTPEFEKTNWIEEPEIGGNLQARLRAVVLMGLSNRYSSLLLSTGNKSEIAVGYSTLYGDSCGAYNVLKDIYKTQVYELANWRNEQSSAIPPRSISKAPSAELKPNQRDEDNLPPYDILDAILVKHIEGRMSAQEIIAAGHEQEIVEKVLRLVRLSEHKRSQSCLGVKISSMLFGKDRRYPITNKF